MKGAWLALLLGALGVAACRPAGIRQTRALAAGELCPSLLPGERWESAPWEDGCPWFEIRGGEAVEVPHGLGRRPAAVLLYLSFVPDGAEAVLAAGDMGRVVQVGEDRVTVANATEQDMYARLVLW